MNSKLTQTNNRQSGFTLVELLVVIAIIGILTAVGIPMYNGYQTSAKVNATQQNYTSFKTYMGAEITKCAAGLVNQLADAKASPNTITCPSGTTTPATMATYFVAYGVKGFKNPYNSSDATPVVSGAATASAANAGKIFINSSDAACTAGVAIQAVTQDPNNTANYLLYPTSSECISGS